MFGPVLAGSIRKVEKDARGRPFFGVHPAGRTYCKQSRGDGQSAFSFCGSSSAFMLSLILPRSSVSSTLTRTV